MLLLFMSIYDTGSDDFEGGLIFKKMVMRGTFGAKFKPFNPIFAPKYFPLPSNEYMVPLQYHSLLVRDLNFN